MIEQIDLEMINQEDKSQIQIPNSENRVLQKQQVFKRRRRYIYYFLCILLTFVVMRALLIAHVIYQFTNFKKSLRSVSYDTSNLNSIPFCIELPNVYSPLNISLKDTICHIYSEDDNKNPIVTLSLPNIVEVKKYSDVRIQECIKIEYLNSKKLLEVILNKKNIIVNISSFIKCRFCFLDLKGQHSLSYVYKIDGKQSNNSLKGIPFEIDEIKIDRDGENVIAQANIIATKALLQSVAIVNIRTDTIKFLIKGDFSVFVEINELKVKQGICQKFIQISLKIPKEKIYKIFPIFKKEEINIFFNKIEIDGKDKLRTFDINYYHKLKIKKKKDESEDKISDPEMLFAVDSIKQENRSLSCKIKPNLKYLAYVSSNFKVVNNFGPLKYFVYLNNINVCVLEADFDNVAKSLGLNFSINFKDISGFYKEIGKTKKIVKFKTENNLEEQILEENEDDNIFIVDGNFVYSYNKSASTKKQHIVAEHYISSTDKLIGISTCIRGENYTNNGLYIYFEHPKIEIMANVGDFEASILCNENSYRYFLDGSFSDCLSLISHISLNNLNTPEDLFKYDGVQNLRIKIGDSDLPFEFNESDKTIFNLIVNESCQNESSQKPFDLTDLIIKQESFNMNGSFIIDIKKSSRKKLDISGLFFDNKIILRNKLKLKIWPEKYSEIDRLYDIEINDKDAILEICYDEANKQVDFGIEKCKLKINTTQYARYFEILHKPFVFKSDNNLLNWIIAAKLTSLKEQEETNMKVGRINSILNVETGFDQSGIPGHMWHEIYIRIRPCDRMIKCFKYGKVQIKNNKLVFGNEFHKEVCVFETLLVDNLLDNYIEIKIGFREEVGFNEGIIKLEDATNNNVEWERRFKIQRVFEIWNCFIENIRLLKGKNSTTEQYSSKFPDINIEHGGLKAANNFCLNAYKTNLLIGFNINIKRDQLAFNEIFSKFVQPKLGIFFSETPGYVRFVFKSNQLCIFSGFTNEIFNILWPSHFYDLQCKDLTAVILFKLNVEHVEQTPNELSNLNYNQITDLENINIKGNIVSTVPGKKITKIKFDKCNLPLIDLYKKIFKRLENSTKSSSNSFFDFVHDPTKISFKLKSRLNISPDRTFIIDLGFNTTRFLELCFNTKQNADNIFDITRGHFELINAYEFFHKFDEDTKFFVKLIGKKRLAIKFHFYGFKNKDNIVYDYFCRMANNYLNKAVIWIGYEICEVIRLTFANH